jgi:hypothetical protein
MKIFFAGGKSVNRGRLRLRLNSHWESLGYFDLSDLENRFDLGISELQEGDKLVLNAAAESFVGSVLFRYPLMEVSDEALSPPSSPSPSGRGPSRRSISWGSPAERP